jgi:hypothetical protein
MSIKEKLITSATIAFLFIIGLTIFNHFAYAPSSVLSGSVAVGNDYRSYLATSTSASANTPIILKTKPGALGSVVIQQSSPSLFRVYDSIAATSAAATIASFPAGAATGTYVFDESVNNGIVIEAPTGFTGIYTVTYR